MKIDGLTHPKTKELAIALGIPLAHGVGLLEFLFAFVGKQTPRGDIGRWSNGVIAAESQWDGDPDVFVNALIYAGFLDPDDEHRLLVHDWPDHAPNWVHAKLKSGQKTIIRKDLRPALSDDIRRGYKPSLGKPGEAWTTDLSKPNGSDASDGPPVEPPDDFDEFWAAYPRKEGKKKARTAWRNLSRSKREAAIADCATRYQHVEKAFIPVPTTYLNGERWNDDPIPPKTYNFGPKAVDNSGAAAEAKRRFHERQRNAGQ